MESRWRIRVTSAQEFTYSCELNAWQPAHCAPPVHCGSQWGSPNWGDQNSSTRIGLQTGSVPGGDHLPDARLIWRWFTRFSLRAKEMGGQAGADLMSVWQVFPYLPINQKKVLTTSCNFSSFQWSFTKYPCSEKNWLFVMSQREQTPLGQIFALIPKRALL